eukprot:COSAG02_NODE_31282_length_536_cov_0.892449_1_plen_47_part_10
MFFDDCLVRLQLHGQVRGVRVVCGGSPCGVDLSGLRRAVMAAQPDYR